LQATEVVAASFHAVRTGNSRDLSRQLFAWVETHYYFVSVRNVSRALPPTIQRRNAYSIIKGKFGSALRSKSVTGQINEALCKVLCHNICVLVQATHELGIEPAFAS
jgi:hypothetical protein